MTTKEYSGDIEIFQSEYEAIRLELPTITTIEQANDLYSRSRRWYNFTYFKWQREEHFTLTQLDDILKLNCDIIALQDKLIHTPEQSTWQLYLKTAAQYNSQIYMRDLERETYYHYYYQLERKLEKTANILLTSYFNGLTPAFQRQSNIINELEAKIRQSFNPKVDLEQILDDTTRKERLGYFGWRDIDDPMNSSEQDNINERLEALSKQISEKEDDYWWSIQPAWHKLYNHEIYERLRKFKDSLDEDKLFKDYDDDRWKSFEKTDSDSHGLVSFENTNYLSLVSKLKIGLNKSKDKTIGVVTHNRSKYIKGTDNYGDFDFDVTIFKPGNIYEQFSQAFEDDKKTSIGYVLITHTDDIVGELYYIDLSKDDVMLLLALDDSSLEIVETTIDIQNKWKRRGERSFSKDNFQILKRERDQLITEYLNKTKKADLPTLEKFMA